VRGDLISDEYLALQQELHARPEGYGASGYKHAWPVLQIAALLGCRTVLDYGCGQGTLGREIRASAWWRGEVFEYDPAVVGRQRRPVPAEIVVCTDVLEHVEPDRLDAVLADVRALTLRYAYLVVSLQPGSKRLADGRGAHLIVWSAATWEDRIRGQGWRVRARYVRLDRDGAQAELFLGLVPR
jgi:hypothetical protein